MNDVLKIDLTETYAYFSKKDISFILILRNFTPEFWHNIQYSYYSLTQIWCPAAHPTPKNFVHWAGYVKFFKIVGIC